MRSYKTIIAEAELKVSSPEAVAAFLKNRADQPAEERWNDPIDEEVEAALLARGDPLINLSLAKYSRYTDTALSLFGSCEPCTAIRLAVLSNTAPPATFFSEFPVALFGGAEQTVKWLVSAPDTEIVALFENSKLDDSFLCDLLEGTKPWDIIPEERLCTIIAILARNERMCRPYDDSYMDGYAEYKHGAVFDAAWKLAERVEPTVRWATALCWLYDRLETDAFSIENPLDLATRWHPNPADSKLVAEEAKDIERGYLSHYSRVRKGLARLALAKNSNLREELLSSDDHGYRCAAYATQRLTAEQLTDGYRKDGELMFNEVVQNYSIWRTYEGRAALKEIAWSVVNNDKHSDLRAVNIYNGIRDDLMKKHPDWFKDEDDFVPKPSDESDTKADMVPLAGQFSQPSSAQAIEQLKSSIQALNKRVGWIWWFSLGALVASIKHF